MSIKPKVNIEDDIAKYPVYKFKDDKLIPIHNLKYWDSGYHLHHFVMQTVRKNSLDFYKRVEHLQKLILMPSGMHYDLHAMGEVTFLKRYGVNKNDFLFNRKKWREGYYDG